MPTQQTLSYWAEWLSDRIGAHVPMTNFTALARRLGYDVKRRAGGNVLLTERDVAEIAAFLLKHGEHHASETDEPYPSPQEIASRAAEIRRDRAPAVVKPGATVGGYKFAGAGIPGIRNYIATSRPRFGLMSTFVRFEQRPPKD